MTHCKTGFVGLSMVGMLCALGIAKESLAAIPIVESPASLDCRVVEVQIHEKQAFLFDTTVTVEHLEKVEESESVTGLSFQNCFLSRQVWNMIVRNPRIKELNLYESQFEDRQLLGLDGMAGVETLSLAYTNIDGTVVEKIQKLKRLTQLNLGGTRLVGVDLRGSDFRCLDAIVLGRLNIGELDLETMKFSKTFRELDLGDTKCTTVALRRILDSCERDRIESLVLCNTMIDDTAFEGLKVRNLGRLDVAGIRLGKNSKQFVASSSGLVLLNLASTTLSDDDANMFRGLVQLQYLDVADNPVSAKTVREIAKLPNLSILCLNKNVIDAECLEHLAGSRSLASLDLSKCNVAVEDLRKFLSRSKVQAVHLHESDIAGEEGLELIREFSASVDFRVEMAKKQR